jgi:hypothetical protein
MSKEPIKHPPKPISAIPNLFISERATYIAFAENQLSLHTISLSLPIINHPSMVQHTRVRPSLIKN